MPTGWSRGQVLAIRPGKKGEVVDANAADQDGSRLHIAWKTKKGVPKKPSLTFYEDLLFAIDDNGVATCWEAATGVVVWNERIGGNYSAAPLLADGHRMAPMPVWGATNGSSTARLQINVVRRFVVGERGDRTTSAGPLRLAS